MPPISIDLTIQEELTDPEDAGSMWQIPKVCKLNKHIFFIEDIPLCLQVTMISYNIAV